ncbi:hypothetical protein CspeluHIS016_0600030 [Cutaneotrichosporon spelunceum]|uniref:Uncharacterized protein n=1 Tax=Cutaneotrichosporon spelunceum TaxID=1672016 RepID=A0AAD3TXW6_9TREE|nr:hypothetical protein CspeluHIS016_0600030 [Cutaneotrichosporon spelunceum]
MSERRGSKGLAAPGLTGLANTTGRLLSTGAKELAKTKYGQSVGSFITATNASAGSNLSKPPKPQQHAPGAPPGPGHTIHAPPPSAMPPPMANQPYQGAYNSNGPSQNPYQQAHPQHPYPQQPYPQQQPAFNSPPQNQFNSQPLSHTSPPQTFNSSPPQQFSPPPNQFTHNQNQPQPSFPPPIQLPPTQNQSFSPPPQNPGHNSNASFSQGFQDGYSQYKPPAHTNTHSPPAPHTSPPLSNLPPHGIGPMSQPPTGQMGPHHTGSMHQHSPSIPHQSPPMPPQHPGSSLSLQSFPRPPHGGSMPQPSGLSMPYQPTGPQPQPSTNSYQQAPTQAIIAPLPPYTSSVSAPTQYKPHGGDAGQPWYNPYAGGSPQSSMSSPPTSPPLMGPPPAMVFAEPQSYYGPPQQHVPPQQPQPQPPQLPPPPQLPQHGPAQPAYAYQALLPGQAVPPGAIPVYAPATGGSSGGAGTGAGGKPHKDNKLSMLNSGLGVVSSGTQLITSFTN